MLKRFFQLESLVEPGQVLVIYGPRRVGKTTLLQEFLSFTSLRYKRDSGDNIRVQHILSSQDFPTILEYVEGYQLLAIDEAQTIPHVGKGLKIIVDERPDMMVIATGSSSFDLANTIGEPLTGRKRTITLYPFAQMELLNIYNRHELRERLPEFLVYGSYPQVVTAQTHEKKIIILQELVDSYILKDILQMEKVKGSKILLNLLKLLAFQVGQEVSYHELATQLGINVKTVQRYIDLFEKTFLITHLSGFSRNLRKEITKKNKYYFLDNGIRNAIIAQFNSLENRNDVGALWENFVVMERMKKRSYHTLIANAYFWRTYSGQEIDLIEERGGQLYAYECKWAHNKNIRPPKEWSQTYKHTSFEVITPQNYLDFIT
ncbi:MAG: ATP-binding protein [Candidatus Kerfeldbacteria bacterium]|nr:ATP-binding protein [Candidatus Kerfeldbacteria bacterium]